MGKYVLYFCLILVKIWPKCSLHKHSLAGTSTFHPKITNCFFISNKSNMIQHANKTHSLVKPEKTAI